ncbi:LysR substrate-binding domain-containing protein [Enterococcus hirae]|uniref:LysR substrate-binding domain-containing protein n=1 Tax=Enterococcus hirae TaxID=1354 RepID=UPI0009BD0663|nr:LysR substrate-binding domain-containing protein [Enterococcus hirae]EMF0308145.1 LysR family transcriptional regulator [Enterococcus hirae]EMF0457878.1 LysR family transcriptional regulator [Enterococcus hirae]OQO33104.1 LysR family transcriptional regulator [Enterococcus hirae]OQO39421.1 LysR family transcriptional regulator [Enterococcus hirae]OQO53017.1 LysR family transcriptional regulator [Enterococcus hirae]
MNTRDIEYYVQIVKQKNFTKVAKYFQVSQPTITYALKRLEKELDAVLITRDRSHHELVITPAGKQLFIHAQSILQEIKMAKAEITQLQKKKLRFGMPPIIGNEYFPKLSSYFIKSQLMDQIEITDGGSRDLYGMIHQGRIDLAILGSTQPIIDQKLEIELLLDKRFMIVVAPTHPFANRQTISFSDLIAEQFVLLNEHYVHPAAFKKLAKQAHIEPKVVYQSNDLAILKSMIRENIGIGFLTEIAIHPEDHLVSIPLSDQLQPHFLISLAKRTQQIPTPLQENVVEVIQQFMKTQKKNKS